ncbi:MAG: transposase [Desulfobacteraceae bacterium]|nr:transposase [Desulfobacteraceae bacterium]
MVQKQKRKKYTAEFKNDAIKLVTEQGYSCNEVARRLGINNNNVTRWVRDQRQEKTEMTENGISPRELEAENKRLKKENKRLLMEREILKKATAFFVKELN